MTRTLASTRAHSVAIIAGLETELARPVGEAVAPDLSSPPNDLRFPYCVMFRLDDFERSGPLSDDEEDVMIEFQVTSVSDTVAGAETMGDNVAEAVMNPAAPITVAGRKIGPMQTSLSGDITRDPKEKPPLFYHIAIYEFKSWREP